MKKNTLTLLHNEIVEGVCIAGGCVYGIELRIKKGEPIKRDIVLLKKALSRINKAQVKIKKIL